MSLSDPIGDMLARIKNSQMRNLKKVEMPSSNFKTKIADVLKNEGYINNFNVLDKAGSYNIEDAKKYFIKNIDGCYNNIVGFPEQKFLKSEMKRILDEK